MCHRRRAFPEQPTGSGYGLGGGSWDSRRAEYMRALGGTLYIWDGRTGRVRAGPHPVGDLVTEVGHSPDGSRVVISELSGTLTLLDGSTLEPAGRPVDLGANVCCVALGPDNRTALPSSADHLEHLLERLRRSLGAGRPRGRHGRHARPSRPEERELGDLLPRRQTRGRDGIRRRRGHHRHRNRPARPGTDRGPQRGCRLGGVLRRRWPTRQRRPGRDRHPVGRGDGQHDRAGHPPRATRPLRRSCRTATS